MSMKESGGMIKLMAMVSITMLMELSMKVNGERINKRVRGERNGQTIAVSQECIKMERSMD